MLRITSEAEVIEAVVATIPDAQITEPDGDNLNLDLSATASIAFDTFVKLSKALWEKLKPLVTAKPEMEIEFEGPGGKIKMKLKNVSQKSLADAADKVMATGSRRPA